ncbi:MAG TPA: polyhydroxyalkanoic acid system family protein [Steroidobacteraceae bacterium]|nr:polyhydroxyalkanoic acid system family protein [Steroidobacteraceae bacterium]
MSVIDIRRKHHFSLAEAREHANRLARDLEREFGLDTAWNKDVLEFRRDGVEGRLTVRANEVHLHAKLGFLLALLRPRIESSIHAHMDELFAAAPEPAKKPGKRRPPGGRKSPR